MLGNKPREMSEYFSVSRFSRRHCPVVTHKDTNRKLNHSLVHTLKHILVMLPLTVIPTGRGDNRFWIEWVEYNYINKKEQINLTFCRQHTKCCCPNKDFWTKGPQLKRSAAENQTCPGSPGFINMGMKRVHICWENTESQVKHDGILESPHFTICMSNNFSFFYI